MKVYLVRQSVGGAHEEDGLISIHLRMESAEKEATIRNDKEKPSSWFLYFVEEWTAYEGD